MKLNVANAYKVLTKYLKGLEETEEYKKRVERIKQKNRADKPKLQGEDSKKNRFEHSKRVAIISAMLAQKWGAIVEDAIIIALLHDIGKSIDEEKMLNICVQENIPVSEFEIEEAPITLHGKISALLFRKEFKGNNSSRMKRISKAIENHVAGGTGMNTLEKIVFIADNIDGKKKGNKLLCDIMCGKIKDPNECIRIIIKDKIKRSEEEGRVYNPWLDATLEDIGSRD